jgi:hypothetical protein
MSKDSIQKMLFFAMMRIICSTIFAAQEIPAQLCWMLDRLDQKMPSPVR